MIGGGVRWGDHRIFGTGASASDNTTGADERTREHRCRGAGDERLVTLEQHRHVRARRWESALGMGQVPASRRWQSARPSSRPRRSSRARPPRRLSRPTAASSVNPHRGGLDRLEGRRRRRLSRQRVDRSAIRRVGHDERTTRSPTPPRPEWGHLVARFPRDPPDGREHRPLELAVLGLRRATDGRLSRRDSGPGEPAAARAGGATRRADGLVHRVERPSDRARCDNGDWYDTRAEAPRWRSQAVFWTAIASRLKHNSAVAWYDVMNEPSASVKEHPIWCAAALGGFCYVQFLTKEPPAARAPRSPASG